MAEGAVVHRKRHRVSARKPGSIAGRSARHHIRSGVRGSPLRRLLRVARLPGKRGLPTVTKAEGWTVHCRRNGRDAGTRGPGPTRRRYCPRLPVTWSKRLPVSRARLAGHIVQRATWTAKGVIAESRLVADRWHVLRYRFRRALSYLADEKGSVTVDGCQPTVSSVSAAAW